MRIYLIGMPGSGKSTLGKKLAENLKALQKNEGKSKYRKICI